MSEYTREEILKLIEDNGGPEGLDLTGADLTGVDLGWQAIYKELNKIKSKDSNVSPIWYSRKTEGINLRGVDLLLADCEETNLECADLEGAKLWDATFSKARLWRANLREAILTGSDFQQADLSCADLRDSETLNTDFRGANLRGACLEAVDLFSAESLAGIHVCGAVLDRTRMRWEQLGGKVGEEIEGDYWLAKEAYLNLKNNFNSLGRCNDASEVYIKERQMEKMCSAPWRVRRVYMGERDLGYSEESRLPVWHPRVLWFCARHTWKWFWDWVAELVCGYGERIRRVLFWMVASLLGFAAYYWGIGGVWLVEPDGSRVAATSFWHYLIYSAGAFTTTEFARFQAADDRVRMVTAIQAIIGIVLAGLLGFVAGNRIRRS